MALSSLSERLPDIYSIDHMQRVKQAVYPLLSILTNDKELDPPFDDLQIIHTSYDRMASVLEHVRGKYAVWLPSTGKVDTPVLADLCEILERDDSYGFAELVDNRCDFTFVRP